MFCSHKWDLISEKTTESRVEHYAKLTGQAIKGSEHLLSRKFIQLLKCDKCGKLKKLVTDI